MSEQDRSFEGLILGDPSCKHEYGAFYHSSLHEYDPYEDKDGVMQPKGTGVYTACNLCGMHLWNVTPPDGRAIIDLDTWGDDEPEDEEEA